MFSFIQIVGVYIPRNFIVLLKTLEKRDKDKLVCNLDEMTRTEITRSSLIKSDI